MKRVKIDDIITDFDGKPLVEAAKNEGKHFTVKQALLNVIGGAPSKSSEEALRIRELGILIQESTDWFVFRESDEAIIKVALDGAGNRYNVMVIGQIALAMKNAEAYKGEVKSHGKPVATKGNI